MKRGDIYVADLQPRSGSEQKGKRPVLVISHDNFNKVAAWKSIIVLPISTSTNQAQRGPTAIFLPKNSGGIDKDSIVLCHQVTTLDRSKLSQYLGSLSADQLSEVEKGLKAAMDLI